MAGTMAGGKAASQTNRLIYGEDFYIRIGSLGGSAKTSKPKGFAAMSPEKRSAAGQKGGSRSRRGAKK